MDGRDLSDAPKSADGEYWRVRFNTQINTLIDIIAVDEARVRAEREALEKRIAATQHEMELQATAARQQIVSFIHKVHNRSLMGRILACIPAPLRDWVNKRQFNRDVAFLRQSGRLDENWYLATNPDVAESSSDPIVHFVMYGAREGRRPRADFDTIAYLIANPDLARSGENPFVHFVRANATSEQSQR